MTTTETVQIQMPQMGESVTEGTILEWHTQEGEWVEEGDTVVEVSTDKVDAEVPAPASGTITKVLVGPDETIEVGKPLAEMTKGAAPSGDGGAPAAPAKPEGPPAAAPDDARARASATRDAEQEAAVDDGARATPLARRAAEANGVSLKSVKGTGPGGKITKSDVLAAEGDGAPAAAPAAAE